VDIGVMSWEFPGELISWRGPAPYHFIEVPEEVADALHDLASVLTYGWGVIPVTVRIGQSEWTTSLFPKDGLYLVPIKDAIRRGEGLVLGDVVSVEVEIRS
jgi:hypothetical protein